MVSFREKHKVKKKLISNAVWNSVYHIVRIRKKVTSLNFYEMYICYSLLIFFQKIDGVLVQLQTVAQKNNIHYRRLPNVTLSKTVDLVDFQDFDIYISENYWKWLLWVKVPCNCCNFLHFGNVFLYPWLDFTTKHSEYYDFKFQSAICNIIKTNSCSTHSVMFRKYLFSNPLEFPVILNIASAPFLILICM